MLEATKNTAVVFWIGLVFVMVPAACVLIALGASLQCAHVIFHHQPGESVVLPFVILGAALTPLWLVIRKMRQIAHRPPPPGYLNAMDRDGWPVVVRENSIEDNPYDRRFQHAERDDGAPISIKNVRL
jgi:hypothetical protein